MCTEILMLTELNFPSETGIIFTFVKHRNVFYHNWCLIVINYPEHFLKTHNGECIHAILICISELNTPRITYEDVQIISVC